MCFFRTSWGVLKLLRVYCVLGGVSTSFFASTLENFLLESSPLSSGMIAEIAPTEDRTLDGSTARYAAYGFTVSHSRPTALRVG